MYSTYCITCIHLEGVIQILFNLFLDLEKVQQSLVCGQHTRFQAHIHETSDYGADSVNNNRAPDAAVFQTIGRKWNF